MSGAHILNINITAYHVHLIVENSKIVIEINIPLIVQH